MARERIRCRTGHTPKFDDFRGVLYVSGRECHVRSKRGNVLRRFADLALRVGVELHARDAILDGELVALDDEGRMDFRGLLAGKGWMHYAAFDVLWLNGKDLRGLPLIKRKRRLEQLIPANNSTLSRVLAVEEHGRELFETAQRLLCVCRQQCYLWTVGEARCFTIMT